MADYTKMTDEDFETYLHSVSNLLTVDQIMEIPGVYSIVAEELNNDVLDAWAEANHELAYPLEQGQCPLCRGEMTWCYSCRMYSSTCCEEYGTCMCS